VNVQLLIDSLVQQVTVLIAQLATSGGIRAPIAHVANQVFVDLARELERQGVGRKVSADMFGMALRAYQRKLRRLTSAHGQPEQTLGRSVVEEISELGTLSRRQLLRRFRTDDEVVVRAVLRDLVEAGVLACSGSGPDASYRVISEGELAERLDEAREQGLEELLWAIVYRSGPISAAGLAARLPLDEKELAVQLEALHVRGRLERSGDLYAARDFSVALNAASGWEAAVFDHVQAVVQTICQRLRAGGSVPAGSETVGGSTYSFDLWDGHPLAAEVESALARFRVAHTGLRERVEAFNRQHGRPARYRQVIVYGGQCLLEREPDANEADRDQEDGDD
jgi:hypothetical protein